MFRMPVTAAAFALVLSSTAFGAEPDDCTKEVFQSVEKQSKQIAYRMESDVISTEGPLKIKMEYVMPGRMRQVATLAADPKPVETILVDGKAWSNDGTGWIPLTFQHAEQLIEQMRKSTKADPAAVGKFECLGAETVDGRPARAYKSKPMIPDAMKGADGKEIETTAKNEAVRVVYIDTETGLPMQSVLTRLNAMDKPIFKEVYTYPPDLKIEPPPADKILPR